MHDKYIFCFFFKKWAWNVQNGSARQKQSTREARGTSAIVRFLMGTRTRQNLT